MHELRDKRKVEFIRLVVKELNMVLNSQSMNTQLIVQFGLFKPEINEWLEDPCNQLVYNKGEFK